MKVGAGVAILCVGIWMGALFNKDSAPEASLYSSKVEQTASVGAGTQNSGNASSSTTPSASGISPSTEGERVKVVRVVDGDTIEVLINGKTESVRYIGIDTPETVDPRKPVQCFGVEASKKNKELVEGKMVRLEKDITDRDKYKRLLRYVWVDDALVNLVLVTQGFAKSYSYPPDVAYQDLFLIAEKKAREDKMGLWTACGGVAPAVSTTPSASASASNPSCTIKGNISASGEKIYHMQGCGSYAKTQIDESHGEHWFCSESEAQTAGWRKALNCQ